MAKLNKWNDILSATSSALGGKKRSKKNDFDPFDIFPDWFKTPLENKAENDRQTNKQKDDNDPYELNNYLFRKKAKKGVTPTTYNDKKIEKQITKFSSPPAGQQANAPTNMGEYSDMEIENWDYDNPVISTK